MENVSAQFQCIEAVVEVGPAVEVCPADNICSPIMKDIATETEEEKNKCRLGNNQFAGVYPSSMYVLCFFSFYSEPVQSLHNYPAAHSIYY